MWYLGSQFVISHQYALCRVGNKDSQTAAASLTMCGFLHTPNLDLAILEIRIPTKFKRNPIPPSEETILPQFHETL